MVKLYYTPNSCAASSFISCFIAGIKFDCEIVDLATHITESGINFYTINPKGNVPTIVLDDGTILNENISCLTYISDISLTQNYKHVSPYNLTSERYLMLQQLSFIATELHPTIGFLFNPKCRYDDYIKIFIVDILDKKMKYLQSYLISNKQFICGDSLTVVDIYLHIILSWLGYVGIDINKYPIAKIYNEYISEIPEIKRAKYRMANIETTTI